jgi:hypothetical protein
MVKWGRVMEIFEKNTEVIVVTPGGVLKGKVKSYVYDKYFIHTYVVDADSYAVKVNKIEQLHVYPIKDFGRAVKFFESRYL